MSALDAYAVLPRLDAPTKPAERCPCCGGPILGTGVQWSVEARALLANGRVVEFTGMEAHIFELLWCARRTGALLSRDAVVERIYSVRPDGGPLSAANVVSVMLVAMRRKLRGTGLAIQTPRNRLGGYRLMREPA